MFVRCSFFSEHKDHTGVTIFNPEKTPSENKEPALNLSSYTEIKDYFEIFNYSVLGEWIKALCSSKDCESFLFQRKYLN